MYVASKMRFIECVYKRSSEAQRLNRIHILATAYSSVHSRPACATSPTLSNFYKSSSAKSSTSTVVSGTSKFSFTMSDAYKFCIRAKS